MTWVCENCETTNITNDPCVVCGTYTPEQTPLINLKNPHNPNRIITATHHTTDPRIDPLTTNDQLNKLKLTKRKNLTNATHKTLTATTNNKTITISHSRTKKRQRVIRSHKHPITHVTLHNTTLITTDTSGTIRITNTQTGKTTLIATNATSNQTTYNQQQNQIAITTHDSIHLINEKTAIIDATIHLQHGPAEAVQFTNDGNQILASTGKKTYYTANITPGETLREADTNPHTLAVTPISRAMSEPNNYIAFITNNKDIWIIDPTGTIIADLNNRKNSPTTLAFTAEGDQLITGNANGTVSIWEITQNPEKRTIKAHDEKITAITITPNQKHFITASADHTIKIWSTRTQTRLTTFKLCEHHHATALTTNDTGTHLSTAHSNGIIHIWNLKNNTLIHSRQTHTDTIRALAFTPDGKLLYSGGDDGKIKITNLTERAIQPEEINLRSWVRQIAFNPTGTAFLATTDNGNLTIFNTKTHEKTHQIANLGENITAAFLGDGCTIVTCGPESGVIRWEGIVAREPDDRVELHELIQEKSVSGLLRVFASDRGIDEDVPGFLFAITGDDGYSSSGPYQGAWKRTTPLHVAAQMGNLNAISTLLAAGYSCDQEDEDGCTPLFLACISGQHEVIKLLLKKIATLINHESAIPSRHYT
jgi:WD40 repeat protein